VVQLGAALGAGQGPAGGGADGAVVGLNDGGTGAVQRQVGHTGRPEEDMNRDLSQ